MFIVLFLADLLISPLKDDQLNVWLFEYLMKFLQGFDNKAYNFTDFHFYFMIGLTNFIGFHPNIRELCLGFSHLKEGDIRIHIYRSSALLE
ncbi:MAG: hypothetical protein ABI045_03545 [Flavobacteriales bacterium]